VVEEKKKAERTETPPNRRKPKPKPKPKEKQKPKPKAKAKPKPEKRRSRNWGWLVAAFILLAAAAVCGYFYLELLNTEPIRPKLYVIADVVFTHDTPDLGKDSRKEQLPFKTQVEVYGREGDYVVTQIHGQKRYIPEVYLDTELVLEEINSIYLNEEAHLDVDDSYEKRAVRDFFNKNGIIGTMPEDRQKQLYGAVQEKETWWVYGAPKDADWRSATTGRFVGGEYHEDAENPLERRPDDLALLLHREGEPHIAKLVVFFFDEGLQRTHHHIEPLSLEGYDSWVVRKLSHEEAKQWKFKENAQKKITKEKDGILLGVEGTDNPVTLVLVENGSVKTYAEKPAFGFGWF
ncbi:MAG: hypothetical protein AAF570_00305, partial [Bacteroidota bacterium]